MNVAARPAAERHRRRARERRQRRLPHRRARARVVRQAAGARAARGHDRPVLHAPSTCAALAAGATERWAPGPGYHERIFRSTEEISDGERRGRHPPALRRLPARRLSTAGEPTPLQLWLHWRGGNAHSAGAAIPGMFRDLGDAPRRDRRLAARPRHVVVVRRQGPRRRRAGVGRRARPLHGRREPRATSPATRWAAGARSC